MKNPPYTGTKPVLHMGASFLPFKAGFHPLPRKALSHCSVIIYYNLIILFALPTVFKSRNLILVIIVSPVAKTAQIHVVGLILESGIWIGHLYPLKPFFIILYLLISLVGH